MASSLPDSLLGRLSHWAATQPDKRVFTYLDDSGAEVFSLTYQVSGIHALVLKHVPDCVHVYQAHVQELETRSAALAAHILDTDKLGVRVVAGDRVLLVFVPSLDFILTFVACLRAGVCAVPVYPPDTTRGRAHIAPFATIARSAGARVALSHSIYRTAVSVAALKDAATRMFTGFRSRATDAGDAGNAWPDLHWVSVDAWVRGSGRAGAPIARAQPSATAFLQYTSGSTSEPKGVMISHANLAANLDTIVRSLRAGTDTVVCSWLPQYHDMGLIGSHLGIVFCGGSGYYMSPVSFIKRPAVWVEAVSKYRATHLQSPNFGYKLVARKWRDALAAAPAGKTLDLSCVRHMFNAAEPITVAALHDFLTTFSAYGLSAAAMAPGFGLAEHTVYVSDGGDCILRADREAFESRGEIAPRSTWPLAAAAEVGAACARSEHGTMDFVSCGPVAPWTTGKNDDIIILIVNADTRCPVAAPDRVGEIWIDSPSKAGGYWGQPDMSAAAFNAELASPSAESASADHQLFERFAGRRFLRTGDTGFIHDGQLYVCGRIKDIIIVRGRNYYPQDIEQTVELEPSLRPGCSAAFQIRVARAGEAAPSNRPVDAADAAAWAHSADGDDGVALVAEVRDASIPAAELLSVATRLRRSVLQEHGVPLSALLLLKPHTARKTTSGKIARKWNQRAFAAMGTDATSPWHASSGNVLYAWTQELDAGPDDVALISETPDGAAPVGESQAAPPRPAGAYATMVGDELRQALRADVASLLREPSVDRIPTDVALSALGLDSLSITQFSGMLQHEYKFAIPDQLLFAEGASIDWLVTHADDFRAGRTVEAPGPLPTAHAEGAAAASPSPPAPGVEEVGALRPPRRAGTQPSWFERNFPCCVCCF